MKSRKYGLATKMTALTIAGLGLAGIITACGSDDEPDTTPQQVTTTTGRPTTTLPPLRDTTTTLPQNLG